MCFTSAKVIGAAPESAIDARAAPELEANRAENRRAGGWPQAPVRLGAGMPSGMQRVEPVPHQEAGDADAGEN